MAEFYSARGWEIPPLPWTNLSPPFSLYGGRIVEELRGEAITEGKIMRAALGGETSRERPLDMAAASP